MKVIRMKRKNNGFPPFERCCLKNGTCTMEEAAQRKLLCAR
jgi:hypothetical protein